MEVSGQHHVPASLPLEKSLQYALDTRLNGPQRRYDHYSSIVVEALCDKPEGRGFETR
jgi:hypothetical protein